MESKRERALDTLSRLFIFEHFSYTNLLSQLALFACVLLLGATYYGTAVDLWSTGCILAELYAGKPIMPGRTEVEQLHKIFKLCGSPSEDYWRKSKLPHATIFKPQQPYRRCVAETFKDFPTPALGPMETLLSIDPADRGSPASALKSEFFTVKPLPCDPSSLPKYPHSKEFDAKVRDEEARSSGDIDLCFANEDETRELLRDDENASPEVALEFLAKHCQWAVVTLGSNRCLGKCGREEVHLNCRDASQTFWGVIKRFLINGLTVTAYVEQHDLFCSDTLNMSICTTIYSQWRNAYHLQFQLSTIPFNGNSFGISFRCIDPLRLRKD
ncbi:unnamed protein product, partial [Vitis vinifera]